MYVSTQVFAAQTSATTSRSDADILTTIAIEFKPPQVLATATN